MFTVLSCNSNFIYSQLLPMNGRTVDAHTYKAELDAAYALHPGIVPILFFVAYKCIALRTAFDVLCVEKLF